MGLFGKLFGPRGVKPRPFYSPAKRLEDAETVGQALDSLKAKLNADRWERDLAGEQVRLCLLLPSGEKICGQGPTTRDAFFVLRDRVKKVFDV